ncbi:MAG: glycosyltransferase 87 family protein [Renibacterium salmoninarum]|nr:glycosyltransferase 87 family protein [Renibacterium salmoninarum]
MTLRSPLAKSLITLAALIVAAGLIAWAFWIAPVFGLDFRVYVSGGESVLGGGGDLYSKVYDGLLFTYSPFSALFFSLLALCGSDVGLVIFIALSLAIAVLTAVYGVRFVFRQRSVTAVLQHPWLRPAAVVAFGFVVALGPWRETVAFGQINVVLFGLIMADFMINRKRWPTGLLIGIAAGIKLTPLVFGLYFLATGNWRGLRNMALGFVGTIAFGFLVLPKESIAYWLQLLPDTSRIGGAGYVDNLSVKGAILHFFGPDFAVNAPWLIIGILLAAMTFLTVRRSARQGEPMTGIASTALLMLLISPISWSHHWVWVALFFPVLIRNIADLPAQARVLRVTGLGLVLLAVPIFMFSPKTIGALFGSENLNSQIPTVWLMASSVGVFWGLAAVLWWLLASRLKPVRRELPAPGAELAQLRQRAD